MASLLLDTDVVRDPKRYLDEIWHTYFADVSRVNRVEIAYARPWKGRLGAIWLEGDNTTHITVNGLLQLPEIPDSVLITTVAHELTHYAHGFGSPLPCLHPHPHANWIAGDWEHSGVSVRRGSTTSGSRFMKKCSFQASLVFLLTPHWPSLAHTQERLISLFLPWLLPKEPGIFSRKEITLMITIQRKNLLDPQASWERIETSHEFAAIYEDQEQARAVAITLTQRWCGKQLFRICDGHGQGIETYAVKSLFLVWPEHGVPALSLMAPHGTAPLDALSPWPTISENETSARPPEAGQYAWWQADQRIDVAALRQGYGVSMEEVFDIIVQLKLLTPITNGDIENEIVGVDP